MGHPSKKITLNIVGSQIRKLRDEAGLTQEMLAARCEVLGGNISRGTLAKIEAQIRCVTDQELLVIAEGLKVKMKALFPSNPKLF